MQPYVTQVGVFMTLICLVINLYIEAEAVMTTIIKFMLMDLLYCDMIDKSLNQKCFTPNYPHCFASSLLVLSCIMILHSMISWILGMKYGHFKKSSQEVTAYVPKKRMKKPPDPLKPNKKVRTAKNKVLKGTYNPFKKMTRLVLLAALSKYHALPQLHKKSHIQMRNNLKKYKGFGVETNTKHSYSTAFQLRIDAREPVLTQRLQHYLDEKANSAIIAGLFHLLIDTGCSITYTPYLTDFKEIKDLPCPITLKGVAGDITVTKGGTVHYEVINDNGHVSIIETFAYFHPEIQNRLFSPQRWLEGHSTGKSFEIFHNKGILHLKNGENITFPLDHTSHMPMLPAFHKATEVANTLSEPISVVSANNQNLSLNQKILLKLYFKKGHLGMQKVKCLCFRGIFGVEGIRAGDKGTSIPRCAACWLGGMVKTSIKGTTVCHTNPDILKVDKLTRGQ
jgi:hypothetical protein